jgi:hypothetical protein
VASVGAQLVAIDGDFQDFIGQLQAIDDADAHQVNDGLHVFGTFQVSESYQPIPSVYDQAHVLNGVSPQCEPLHAQSLIHSLLFNDALRAIHDDRLVSLLITPHCR